MSWHTDAIRPRGVQPSHRWRHVGVALLIGLALVAAACGTSMGEGSHPNPTPTSKPTATPMPVPCASWRLVSSPGGGKYPASILSAVSALSPSTAWAVGANYGEGGTVGPVVSLIEQWDGTAWKVVANPGPDFLDGVTALSATDVWGVGQQFDYGVHLYKTLTMHWDGAQWSVVPSANPSSVGSILNAVAAISANDVWAVGQQQGNPDQIPQPLVERWDGTSWHLVGNLPLPPSAAPTNGGSLVAVTHIPGTHQLWAVGEWHAWTNLGRGQPLIERWDGSSWQVVPSPSLPDGALGGGWSGVVALSATNAWAVGSYALKNPIDSHPLIAHWDGTHWQNVVASPDTYGELNSVAAAGANDVRAAGSQLTGPGASSGNGQRVPLVEQWNGTTWQIVTTPRPPSGLLSGSLSMATDGAGNYWAVGSYLNAEHVSQTLTLHCP